MCGEAIMGCLGLVGHGGARWFPQDLGSVPVSWNLTLEWSASPPNDELLIGMQACNDSGCNWTASWGPSPVVLSREQRGLSAGPDDELVIYVQPVHREAGPVFARAGTDTAFVVKGDIDILRPG